MLRGLKTLVAGAAVASLVASGQVAGASGQTAGPTTATTKPPYEGRETYTGSLDGAPYRVEMPAHWNGTLVLFSHGYYPPETAPWPEEIWLANRPQTARWLLQHGYALAASDYRNRYGYALDDGLRDQLALLDWFEANIAQPEHTLTSGQSMGGVISLLLAERHPHRFDGVVTIGAEFDANGTLNVALDITYAIKTLLAPNRDIDLVKADHPIRSREALVRAVTRAVETPEGRARLALAGAFGNIAPWYSAHNPEPTRLAERIRQQALWLQGAYVWGLGPNGRVNLEERAGGNPSWNIGIDYRHQLARSSQRRFVERAYEVAGLDLEADLDRLADAPRIAPDPKALLHMYRYGVASGRTPVPVLTIHNTGDGGSATDQVDWYASKVRQYGDPAKLRHVWVDRGMHLALSTADEAVAIQTLLRRVETGDWPRLDPRHLNERVAGFDRKYQRVFDITTGVEKAMPPAFVRYRPPEFLRPSW
jgi:pimeloyl-ACP methyl ester carboxylesterase